MNSLNQLLPAYGGTNYLYKTNPILSACGGFRNDYNHSEYEELQRTMNYELLSKQSQNKPNFTRRSFGGLVRLLPACGRIAVSDSCILLIFPFYFSLFPFPKHLTHCQITTYEKQAPKFSTIQAIWLTIQRYFESNSRVIRDNSRAIREQFNHHSRFIRHSCGGFIRRRRDNWRYGVSHP